MAKRGPGRRRPLWPATSWPTLALHVWGRRVQWRAARLAARVFGLVVGPVVGQRARGHVGIGHARRRWGRRGRG
eukprot:6617950-Alexandrium_andersonii.AAC.1